MTTLLLAVPAATALFASDNQQYAAADTLETAAGGGPVFTWATLTSPVNGPFGGDSTQTNSFPGGFTFPFYQSTYNSVCVSSKTYVMFSGCFLDWSPDGVVPTTAGPDGAIFGHWADLSPTCAGASISSGIMQGTSAPDRVYVIQYDSMGQFGCWNTDVTDLQIWLYETTGVIEVHYDHAQTTNNLAGIENQAGTVGVQYGVDFQITSPRAVQYRPFGFVPGPATNDPVTPAATLDYTAGGSTGFLSVGAGGSVLQNDGGGIGTVPVGAVLVSSHPDIAVTLNPDGTFDVQFLISPNPCLGGPAGDGVYPFTYELADVFTVNRPADFPADTATALVKVEGCAVPPVYAAPADFELPETAPDLPPSMANGDLDDYFTDNDEPGDDAVLIFGGKITPAGAGTFTQTGGRGDTWSFVPTPYFNGPVTVTVNATDPLGGFTEGTFAIHVLARNNVPELTTKTVSGFGIHEHAGTITIPFTGWAEQAAPLTGTEPTAPGPSTPEAVQSLAYAAGTATPAVFAPGGEPIINTAGDLVFTLQGTGSDFHGVFEVPVQACDDGVKETSVGSFTPDSKCTSATIEVDVAPMNDAPRATAVYDAPPVDEDSGASSAIVINGLKAGPPEEAGQTVSFTGMNVDDPTGILQGPPSLVIAGGQVSLTFLPAPDRSGVVPIELEFTDDGPVGGGHINVAVFETAITVLPVNDQPDFTLGTVPTLVEDDLAVQSLPGFATVTSWGAPDEDGDAATWTLTPDKLDMFDAGPDIIGDTLSFQLAPDVYGTTTVTVVLDDGDGGDATHTRTFVIEVTGVDDPPTASVPDVHVVEDQGFIDLPAWGTLRGGPAAPPSAAEPGTVTAVLTHDAPGLFSQEPTMDSSGRLRFQSALNAHGAATVVVTVSDGAGTGSTSFQIVVEPVNDPPVAVMDSFSVWPSAAATFDVLLNDLDGDGDPLTLVDVGIPTKGSVDIVGNGLQFDAQGQVGASTFTYTITDGVATSTAMVTVELRSNPHAVDDGFSMVEAPDGVAVGQTFDVAGNDLADPNVAAPVFDAFVVAPPVVGSVVKSGATAFTYTPPNGDWTGTASFAYGYPSGSEATVTVTVLPSDDAPRGVADVYSVWENVGQQRLDVLANDLEPDGQSIVIQIGSVTSAAGATVQRTSDGAAVLFTPDPGFEGDVVFTYMPFDGLLAGDPTTVTVHVADPATPQARISQAPLGIVCTGTPFLVSGLGAYYGHTVSSWAWSFGGTPAVGETASFSPTSAGPLPIILTVTFDDAATATAQASVQVMRCSDPVAAFTFTLDGATATFTDASIDPGGSLRAWRWDFGDGDTSSLRSPTHTFAPGTYTVRLIVTNDEGSTSSAEAVVNVDVDATPAPEPEEPTPQPPTPPAPPAPPAPPSPPVGDPVDPPQDIPVEIPEFRDSDGDGVPDVSDALPYDATEWVDLDGDGIGDRWDEDDDGDGFSDVLEAEAGTDPRDPRSFPREQPMAVEEAKSDLPWLPVVLIAGLAAAVAALVVLLLVRRGRAD